jgi:hypothetical protein
MKLSIIKTDERDRSFKSIEKVVLYTTIEFSMVWLLDLSILKAISLYTVGIIVLYLGKLTRKAEILLVMVRLWYTISITTGQIL